jgi:hypothetical protein
MTGLVDTFSTRGLHELISNGRIDATPFSTLRFLLGAAAAEANALKVVLEAEPAALEVAEHDGAAVA